MKKNKAGYLIIASAIIWGAVIIGSAVVLKNTEFKDKISLILTGGVIAHLLMVWAPLGIHLRKRN